MNVRMFVTCVCLCRVYVWDVCIPVSACVPIYMWCIVCMCGMCVCVHAGICLHMYMCVAYVMRFVLCLCGMYTHMHTHMHA